MLNHNCKKQSHVLHYRKRWQKLKKTDEDIFEVGSRDKLTFGKHFLKPLYFISNELIRLEKRLGSLSQLIPSGVWKGETCMSWKSSTMSKLLNSELPAQWRWKMFALFIQFASSSTKNKREWIQSKALKVYKFPTKHKIRSHGKCFPYLKHFSTVHVETTIIVEPFHWSETGKTIICVYFKSASLR